MIKPTNAIGEIEKIRSRFTIGSRLRSKLKSITRFPDSLNNWYAIIPGTTPLVTISERESKCLPNSDSAFKILATMPSK